MSQSIAQKCKAIGISLPTYYQRIAKGMTPEQALNTPPMRKRGKPQPIKSTPKEVDQEPLPISWNKYLCYPLGKALEYVGDQIDELYY